MSRISRFTMDETGVIDPASARRSSSRSRPAASRRARPHRRRPRLRAARQPVPRRRRRREPALGALRRLRAALDAARHVPRRPRDLGQHQRPARQAAAHHARSPTGTGYTIPEGNLFAEAEDTGAQDPARDLRDGLPQPVPLLRRPGDRRGRPRRLLARQRTDAPTTRARPASPSGTTSRSPATTAGRSAWATTSPSRRRLHDEPGHGRRRTSTAPTRSTTRRATPA